MPDQNWTDVSNPTELDGGDNCDIIGEENDNYMCVLGGKSLLDEKPFMHESNDMTDRCHPALTTGKKNDNKNNDKGEGESEKMLIVETIDEGSGIPIDGGWGYMVVTACFGMHILVVGGTKSFGVLFLDLQDKYGVSARTLGWTQGTIITALMSLGFVANMLSQRFTTRAVVFTGGILSGLGLTLSAFVPSYEWFFVTYCMITGVGFALAYAPSIVMVGHHFRKYRSCANGISVSGSGVGTFALPNLMRLVLQEFGLNGCFLLLGAITFNVSVFALLLRPLSSYSRRRKMRRQGGETPELTTKGNGEVSVSLTSCDREDTETTLCNGVHVGDDHGNVITPSVYIIEEEKMNNLGNGAAEEIPGVLAHDNSENLVEKEDLESLSTSQMSLRRRTDCSTISNNGLATHSTLLSERTSLRQDDLICSSLQSIPTAAASSASCSHFKAVICCGKCNGSESDHTTKKPLFEWSLLKNPLFLVYFLSCVCSNHGYGNVFFMLPSHAENHGQSKDNAALLVSIVGITDLVGRVFFGWFSDRQLFPKRFGFVACMALSGCLNVVAPFITSFEGLAAYAALYGLLAGSFISLMAVMLADCLGTDKLGSSFGLTILGMSLTFLISPAICGALRDATQSWTAAFIFSGMSSIIGSIFPLFEPCARKWVEKTEKSGRRPHPTL